MAVCIRVRAVARVRWESAEFMRFATSAFGRMTDRTTMVLTLFVADRTAR